MKRFCLLCALLVAACASSMTPSNDAEAVLRRGAGEFATAATNGNVDRMVSIYADDAVLMPPNAPPFRGRAAIRQYWSGLLAMGKIDANVATDTVTQSGDLAVETGHYAMTILPPNAPAPVKDSGKYIITWRRMNGEWRAVYDIFNSDLPAAR